MAGRSSRDEPTKVVLLVALGIAGLAGAIFVASGLLPERGVSIETRLFSDASRATVSSPARVREAAAPAPPPVASSAAPSDPAQTKANSDRDRRAAQQAALQAALARARQGIGDKEQAFKRFYQPSANCLNPDRRATVECSNEYMRATRDFEQRWAEGNLR